MEDKHKLALYVAYYLARFNNEGLKKLGYRNWNNAYSDIASRLNIKKLSIRNRRDEFDPLFEHRAGWFQRPMSPSRMKVVQALENFNEFQVREIVKDILSGEFTHEQEGNQLLTILTNDKEKAGRQFILRAPTGKSAEDFFIKKFGENPFPVKGELIDCRDLGCGYDFKIKSKQKEFFIEVKGLAEIAGGILFTDKEWKTANEQSEDYFLCVIKNIGSNPNMVFIRNPAKKLNPKKNIYTVLQIGWSVSDKELKLYFN